MKFVLIEDRYDKIIPLLLGADSGFVTSPEYEIIVGTGEGLAGVVASAYAAYVGQRFKEGVGYKTIQQLTMPLNELALWNESRVRDLLRDEVFERLESDGQLEIVSKFGNETLRSLLNEWQASISDANGDS